MVSDVSFYEDKVKDLDVLLGSKDITNRRLGALRLFFFIVSLFMFLAGYFLKKNTILMCSAILPLAVFLVLVVVHGKLKKEIAVLEKKREVTSLYIARINGDFESLKDGGSEFEPQRHDYSLDLDVLGDHSLFALYNISETFYGREEFADLLLGKKSGSERSSGAVKELMGKRDLLIDYQCEASDPDINKNKRALINFSVRDKDIGDKKRNLARFLPFLWIIVPVVFFIYEPFASAAILLIMAVNTAVRFFVASVYDEDLTLANGVSKQADALRKLFLLLENENFEDPYMKELIAAGEKGDVSVSSWLREISSACALCNLRAQPLFALLLNCVLPFDLLCADRLFTMSRKYGDCFRKALPALSSIEALMSCAVVGLVSAESCFPEFTEGAYFEGEDIRHPLLDPAKCVPNSIKLDKTKALITGSNMSGKTTLIRTVGINALLAYAGAPVPAKRVTLGRMKIVSSMRIVDSIEEQMSTFRAELVRIGRIIEVAKENVPMLFLIDEIFRGTNSADRTEGALIVLQNLDKKHIIGLMTTHDYALCDRVSDTMENIVYYHFSEKYNDDSISFDYKLHDGVSHESNARFLMKLVGIE
ncbi:MAG TPA: hypothetical protein DCW41_03940 [Clostridiales bacterium]|nr:hypothetical protein [Clostridiales bacterium]